MALNSDKDVFGVAKQAGLGTLAANPTFSFGLAGGGLTVAANQEADELTGAYLSPSGAWRDKVEAGYSIETRAWVRSIGLLLYGALGTVSTNGSGPYTHTFVLSQNGTPYLSAFVKKGDGSLHGLRDCRVAELEFAWEENGPVEVKSSGPGTVWSVPGSFAPAVAEENSTNYLRPVGGTFKFSPASSTPADAQILGGSVAIKREVESWYFSGDIQAADNDAGACEVEARLTLRPTDMGLWKSLLTGSSSGTSIATTPTYGSFELTFASLSGDTLKLSATRVAFLCDFPGADPGGGADKVELAGLCYRPAVTPITAVLVNSQQTY